jgi:hypothetical protein
MNHETTKMNDRAAGLPDITLDRKPRSDSPLRQLSAEQQAAIIERLKTASHAAVSRELTAAGFPVSARVLWGFRAWYLRRLERRLSHASQMVADLEGLRRLVHSGKLPQLTEEQVFSFAQQSFCLQSILHGESLPFLRIHRLSLDAKELKLKERTLAVRDRRNDLLNRRQAKLEEGRLRREKAAAAAPRHTQEQGSSPSAGISSQTGQSATAGSESQPGTRESER